MIRKIQRLGIVGVGLIGGSLGMALAKAKAVSEITGFDVDSANLEEACSLGAITRGACDLAGAVRDADVVVIATPVGQIPGVLAQVAQVAATTATQVAQRGLIVTDVGSTKGTIVRQAQTLLPPGITFIGGHPMTGSERGGVRSADPYLFENAIYILTPGSMVDDDAFDTLSVLLRATGARILVMEPEDHDLVVACVSHLPYLVATMLVETARELDGERDGTLGLAAGGFRDTTRVASGSPALWRDICLSNRDALLGVIARFAGHLDAITEALKGSDGEALLNRFASARETRGKIPLAGKGLLLPLHEIMVTVEDKPGVIGRLATILGDAGINITDIEIMKIREGEGGTIRLGFGDRESAEGASNLLGEKGFVARLR